MEVATMLDEVDRRIAETEKDMYEFKRDVIGELWVHEAIVIHKCLASQAKPVKAYSVLKLNQELLHCGATSGVII